MAKVRVGLVGIGKIARDQHIPVLAASGDFDLVACVHRPVAAGDGAPPLDGIARFDSVEAMLAAVPMLDAVAVASPPAMHFAAARAALEAGKHVLIEKPPCATLAELDHLTALAGRAGKTLFQTWHLRHAPRVADAARWLKGKTIRGGRIIWKEDAGRFHPGQDWIWQSGGFGVFDPGINAISVLTHIQAEPIFVETAELFFPADCDSPVTAHIGFTCGTGARIAAEMDCLSEGEPAWDIELETDGGPLALRDAATTLTIDGKTLDFPPDPDGHHAEYASLYRRFAALIRAGAAEIDATPFRLVADAFLIGKRRAVPPLRLEHGGHSL